MTCSRSVAAIITTFLATFAAQFAQAHADSGSCTTSGQRGSNGVVIAGVCVHHGVGSSDGDTPGTAPPPTKVVLCGRPSSADNGLWDSRCGTPKFCYDTASRPGKRLAEDAYGTFLLANGKWVLQSVWCPATADPIPTTEALREQALRLLPSVQIGSAWTTRALVNAQTILWAATDPDRGLANVTVVGRRVALRIGFDHATWNFGDQHTDTSSAPGKVYDHAGDPCSTAQCPDYYGHTYTDTGPVTITLTVAWHAQFSLDNGATWTDVDAAPLTGPATTHRLTVVQARGILVHDPDR